MSAPVPDVTAAQSLLPVRMAALARGSAPGWLPGTDRLLRCDDQGAWLVVEATGAERKVPTVPDGAGAPFGLPDGVLAVVAADRLLRLDLDTWVDDGPAPGPGDVPSPDHEWLPALEGPDLVLRRRRTGDVRRVTTDGTPEQPYATPPDLSSFAVAQQKSGLPRRPIVAWSPDGTRLLTHRIDQRGVRTVHLLQTCQDEVSPGRPIALRYPVPGDPVVPLVQLLVVEVSTGSVTALRHEPFPVQYLSPVLSGQAWWAEDGGVWFVSGDRPHRDVRLFRADPEDGSTVVVLRETSDTQVQTGPLFTDNLTRVLPDGRVLWWSERDGWGHLYVREGDELRQLTSGPWQVRDVVCVDGDRVVFTAAGRETGSDPYLRQLYAVALGGGDPVRFTEDELDHHVTAAPSGSLLLDEPARWDVAARWLLRTVDGTVVADLGGVDLAPLRAAGWQPPQRISGLAADGTTRLYGLLHLPAGWRAEGSYPVLDAVYPGPQVGISNVRSPGATGHVRDFGPADAALGFVVVTVDGRGTPLRSKEFAEHTRRHGPQYLDDHAAVITQLAATRPWMDLSRVGIWGASGGGYASTRALIERPDVFRVAVSLCGNHDDRLYHALWSERFFGIAGEDDLAARSNVEQAHRLEGRLLLVHGDLDDNVLPAHTLRLLDALLAADKDVEVLVVPNADHGLIEHMDVWMRRRWQFLLRHLAGGTP